MAARQRYHVRLLLHAYGTLVLRPEELEPTHGRVGFLAHGTWWHVCSVEAI